MTIDPTRLHIEVQHPIHDESESFQSLMAEQLRHAPWLLLSVMIHGIAIGILWMLPAKTVREQQRVVTMAPVDEPEDIQEIVQPEEKIEPQEVDEDVVLETTDIETESDAVDDSFEDVESVTQSAFDSDNWNVAVGLGGGAAGKFSGRASGRKRIGRRGKQTAISIVRGLEWLKDHQDEDGKWDADEFMKHDTGEPCTGPGNGVHDVGITGLALLAFLGDGHTLRSGTYKNTVKRAVRWLLEQQDPESGLFGAAASHDFIYGHMIATLAICEAYGLSDYKLMRKPAQRAINYLESHRNPYLVWRYQPRDQANDTSVTGWGVLAYKSAQDFGLKVNDQALKMCGVWLDQVTDQPTGRHGYQRRGQPSSRHPGDHEQRFPARHGEAMTAVGLLSRIFLGQDPKDRPVMLRAADTIAAKPPVWNPDAGTIDAYYWYYASYALYQLGGPRWTKWAKALDRAVVQTQRGDGNALGSWDPVGAWGEDGGRVYSTAISVLTLEVYYRYGRVLAR